MVWYFQASAQDRHDWDSTQAPVLIDGQIDGRPRKLQGLAARNGYYCLLVQSSAEARGPLPVVTDWQAEWK